MAPGDMTVGSRPYFELAASYAWIGRRGEAAHAVSELLKLRPGTTVQDYVAMQPYGNATFVRGVERIADGLRKAGLPETPDSRPPAAAAEPKWCAGVKIAVIVPGGTPASPDMMSKAIYNGFRQAELDLGPTVGLRNACASGVPQARADLHGRARFDALDGARDQGRLRQPHPRRAALSAGLPADPQHLPQQEVRLLRTRLQHARRAFIDKTNVDAVAPLVEKSIR